MLAHPAFQISDQWRAKLLPDSSALLGTTGTPGYVIGNDVIVGAIGITGLKQQIDSARGIGAH